MRLSLRVCTSVSTCVVAFIGVRMTQATEFVVSYKQNIYGAGLPYTPDIIGDGLPPSVFYFTAGPNQAVTFSPASGTVNGFGGTRPSTDNPDGYGPSSNPFPPGQSPTAPADYPGFMGLSGLRDVNNSGYLIGVFLTDSPPAQPAPPTLDFSNNKSFASLSPLTGQLFFIGDGLTGTGTGDVQKFLVPPTATRLYMGFIDSFFVDNLGAITANVEISMVPEPSALLLLGIGEVGLLGYRKRTR